MEASGWSGLFAVAFRQSRNPMALVDEERRHVDVNGAYLRLIGYKREELVGRPIWEFVFGGPLMTQEQWAAALATRRFTGEAAMVCRDGRKVTIQWGAGTEIVTGRRLVLFVALGSGARRIKNGDGEGTREPRPLSKREKEVVRLVALGYTGPEIAAELHISHDTVRTHVRNAMEKLHARSRAQLVAKALSAGLVLE